MHSTALLLGFALAGASRQGVTRTERDSAESITPALETWPFRRLFSDRAQQHQAQQHRSVLARRCTRSLVTYHKALTSWFTGKTKVSAFSEFLGNLSLSPAATLQDPSEKQHTYAALVRILRTLHGKEPLGQEHIPDRRSIRIVSADDTTVTLTFHERIVGSDGALKRLIMTDAVCDALKPSTTADSAKVQWRSFVEKSLPLPSLV